MGISFDRLVSTNASDFARPPTRFPLRFRVELEEAPSSEPEEVLDLSLIALVLDPFFF